MALEYACGVVWTIPHYFAICYKCGEQLADAGWRPEQRKDEVATAFLLEGFVYRKDEEKWERSRRFTSQDKRYRADGLFKHDAGPIPPRPRRSPKLPLRAGYLKMEPPENSPFWHRQVRSGHSPPGVVSIVERAGTGYPLREVRLPVTVQCPRCPWPNEIITMNA